MIEELGTFILQVGTIFKILHAQETILALCTDEGLHFAEIKPDMSLVLKPHMALFPDKMIRTATLIKPGIILCADFN